LAILAVAGNTVSKVAIGAAIGGGAFAIAAMASACLLVGSMALWLTLSSPAEHSACRKSNPLVVD
jgi:hypothetical protein